MTTEKRRAAQAQFERLRSAVTEEPRARFAHLQGHAIFVWFTRDEKLAAPKADSERVDSLLEALESYEPDSSWTKLSSLQPEDRLPIENIEQHPSGFSFYALEFEGTVPASNLFELKGFELSLAFQSQHSPSTSWHELHRVVQSHDKTEIQDLIVTVGGPGKTGLMFPSDQLLFDVARQSNPVEIRPTFIERVFAHLWWTGEIVLIYPDIRRLRPGGFTPAFYSLEPRPVLQPEFELEDKHLD